MNNSKANSKLIIAGSIYLLSFLPCGFWAIIALIAYPLQASPLFVLSLLAYPGVVLAILFTAWKRQRQGESVPGTYLLWPLIPAVLVFGLGLYHFSKATY